MVVCVDCVDCGSTNCATVSEGAAGITGSGAIGVVDAVGSAVHAAVDVGIGDGSVADEAGNVVDGVEAADLGSRANDEH